MCSPGECWFDLDMCLDIGTELNDPDCMWKQCNLECSGWADPNPQCLPDCWSRIQEEYGTAYVMPEEEEEEEGEEGDAGEESDAGEQSDAGE